jgi:hypothetical protein
MLYKNSFKTYAKIMKNEKLQITLVSIEEAFAEIRNRIGLHGRASVGKVLAKHGLPSGLSGSLYRMGIIGKNGDSGGAVSFAYEFLSNKVAREVWDEYLENSRATQKKTNAKRRSIRITDLPVRQPDIITFEDVRSDKPNAEVAAEVLQRRKPKQKKAVVDVKTTFEIRIFGFSLYKIIRS